ncbi:DUF5709 domain-containing protein [Streptomyces vietnamensis]|uniref:DUF5709 domain-containing protein n=1 Tax=Streptomyces vietnamensis TaxID=362257 RepID=A0A0B5I5B9_9ACTN|nr:DUF5709 domain-containing protein [Streptomyces vietnamensis]AJF69295.1 hypothetical protein SVTN_38585 [Streptomyces vietnamensis]
MTEAQAWGDDVYQPDGSEVQDDVGLLDYEDTLEGPVGNPLDTGYSPPERPLGAEHTGVTAAERQRGESLDERLAEEEPELPLLEGDGLGDTTDTDGELLDDQVGGRRAGRLMAEDEGTAPIRAELNARDLGIDGGAASAEEAAMHIIDEE